MNHRLEVADVLRGGAERLLNKFGNLLSRDQHRALRAITVCRTQVLGGHLLQCNDCGHSKPSYNSCRNRHCPKCQGFARAKWLDARAEELLPVPYFHVVFTLPGLLGPLAYQNKKAIYGMLFRAAWETVRDLAENPKHLGCKAGMLSVLHTWGSNLSFHPHLHCIVPGGGISAEGNRWVSVRRSRKRKAFFLPVGVMSRVFRGKFIQKLKVAHRKGDLVFFGESSQLKTVDQFNQLLNRAVKSEWVVYCKRPFGGPSQVLKYLARYTHRVAISSSRLVQYSDGKVSFRWKDYSNGGHTKVMTLSDVEFIRRFLMHVVPSGFVRIRHHGFLSNRNRRENLKHCRELLEVKSSPIPEATKQAEIIECKARCPKCQSTHLVRVDLPAQLKVPIRFALSLLSTESESNYQDSS